MNVKFVYSLHKIYITLKNGICLKTAKMQKMTVNDSISILAAILAFQAGAEMTEITLTAIFTICFFAGIIIICSIGRA